MEKANLACFADEFTLAYVQQHCSIPPLAERKDPSAGARKERKRWNWKHVWSLEEIDGGRGRCVGSTGHRDRRRERIVYRVNAKASGSFLPPLHWSGDMTCK